MLYPLLIPLGTASLLEICEIAHSGEIAAESVSQNKIAIIL